MKKLLLAGVLALPLAMLPTTVRAQDYGCGGQGGCNSCGGGLCSRICGFLHGKSFGCPTCLSPWYAYWPYRAYFQQPAPLGEFPYWAPPMSPSGYGEGMMGGTATASPGGEMPMHGGAAPGYWYGK